MAVTMPIGNVLLLQHRPLLDVKFDKGVIVAFGECDILEPPLKPDLFTRLVGIFPLFVFEAPDRLQG